MNDSSKNLLNIAGFQKYSTVSWPDKISAVLFLQGCLLDCEYCFNRSMIDPKKPGVIDFEEVIEFLKTRIGLLDGVVFSGGEPLMQSNIIEAIKQTKKLGFDIGLHTSGMVPKIFEQILPELSWVGFDIKAPLNYEDDVIDSQPNKYEIITRTKNIVPTIKESIDLLLNSHLGKTGNFEFRTTFDDYVLDNSDLAKINQDLAKYAEKYSKIASDNSSSSSSSVPLEKFTTKVQPLEINFEGIDPEFKSQYQQFKKTTRK